MMRAGGVFRDKLKMRVKSSQKLNCVPSGESDLCGHRVRSDRDPLDLVERDLVAGAIIELGRSGALPTRAGAISRMLPNSPLAVRRYFIRRLPADVLTLARTVACFPLSIPQNLASGCELSEGFRLFAPTPRRVDSKPAPQPHGLSHESQAQPAQ